jgi:hypothetical protein
MLQSSKYHYFKNSWWYDEGLNTYMPVPALAQPPAGYHLVRFLKCQFEIK